MQYDEEYFRKREGNIDVSEFKDILDHLKRIFPKAKKILEVGCGTGRLMMFLKERGYIIHGCDISDYAVKIAKQRGLEVRKCNAMNLSEYSDESYDVVISQHLLEHCEDDFKALLESLRVAKQGVIHLVPGHECDDPTHVRNHYTKEMVLDLLEKLEEYYPDYFAIVKPDSNRMFPDWIIVIIKR